MANNWREMNSIAYIPVNIVHMKIRYLHIGGVVVWAIPSSVDVS